MPIEDSQIDSQCGRLGQWRYVADEESSTYFLHPYLLGCCLVSVTLVCDGQFNLNFSLVLAVFPQRFTFFY